MKNYILSLCAVSLFLCSNTRGQTYNLIDVGPRGIYSMGLNNLDDICGTTSGYEAYLWSNGVRTNLGTLGSTSFAAAINDNDQVVGYSYNGTMCAARYSAGTVTDMGALPNAVASYASAINNSGQAVGYTDTGPGSYPYYPTLWQGGTAISLGVIGWADDINNLGTIVGQAGGGLAFSYSQGAGMKFLTNFTGSRFSEAFAVNDSGLIVGMAAIPMTTTRHAIVWNNGNMADLGILGGPLPNKSSQANSVNNLGQIVGMSDVQSGTHAFLYDPVNGMRDLNLFIDPSLGVTLQDGLAINDLGDILAEGSNGEAYLLKVVPEPCTAILVVLGTIPFLCRRRARPRRIVV